MEGRAFAADQTLTADDLLANSSTIANVRLWDPTVLLTTYRQLQELRPFYQFGDVDVDRYVLNGEVTQVMLAPRELDEADLPGSGWVNRHLVFTHGYRAVVSPANSVTSDGQPAFLVKDITQATAVPDVLNITQPRLYFGEAVEAGNFVIVGTKEQEVDYPLGTSEGQATFAFNSYDGAGGIRIGSFFRRAAFALRFADLNTLISGQITGDSRVLMVRNIKDIVEKAAPFLHADADPYTVIADGRLVWVIDLYTTTDRYPYATRAYTGRLNAQRSDLPNGFNYVRNSVKATIDAYDGTVKFYVVDEADPMLAVYRGIFPSLFTPMAEMPAVLREHLRYPEDLFRVQSDMFQQYHVTDPRVFFNNTLAWQVARDPSTTPAESMRLAYSADNRPMVPYYLLMRLPGEADLSYLVLQPFTAASRPNMVSFLVAKSDPAEYGKLISFELPADSFVDGPSQVGARINQDPDVSREFTLLGQEGSEVVRGNMLVVPIEESILYVQPIYLQASQDGAGSSTAIPEFKRVVVVFGSRIEMREIAGRGSVGGVRRGHHAFHDDHHHYGARRGRGERPGAVAARPGADGLRGGRHRAAQRRPGRVCRSDGRRAGPGGPGAWRCWEADCPLPLRVPGRRPGGGKRPVVGGHARAGVASLEIRNPPTEAAPAGPEAPFPPAWRALLDRTGGPLVLPRRCGAGAPGGPDQGVPDGEGVRGGPGDEGGRGREGHHRRPGLPAAAGPRGRRLLLPRRPQHHRLPLHRGAPRPAGLGGAGRGGDRGAGGPAGRGPPARPDADRVGSGAGSGPASGAGPQRRVPRVRPQDRHGGRVGRRHASAARCDPTSRRWVEVLHQGVRRAAAARRGGQAHPARPYGATN